MRTAATLLCFILLATPALAAAAFDQGRADFDKLCAPCHGVSGKGDGAGRLDRAGRESDADARRRPQ